jgi:hypothetical protein
MSDIAFVAGRFGADPARHAAQVLGGHPQPQRAVETAEQDALLVAARFLDALAQALQLFFAFHVDARQLRRVVRDVLDLRLQDPVLLQDEEHDHEKGQQFEPLNGAALVDQGVDVLDDADAVGPVQEVRLTHRMTVQIADPMICNQTFASVVGRDPVNPRFPPELPRRTRKRAPLGWWAACPDLRL